MRMGTETDILGIIIVGILGLLFQYMDSSVILTLHIIRLIGGFL